MARSKKDSMKLPSRAPTLEEWIAFKEKQDKQRRRMSFYKKLLVISEMMEKKAFANATHTDESRYPERQNED